MLDVLQVGDDRERHDDEKAPGTPFAEMNDRPRADLVGILPYAEEGADVLGEPDEEADQDKGDEQRHLPVTVIGPKHDRCSCVEAERACGDVPAIITDIVVAEKVDVDAQRNHRRHPDGTPRDTVIFSIIDAEWQGVKRHLQHRLDSHA